MICVDWDDIREPPGLPIAFHYVLKRDRADLSPSAVRWLQLFSTRPPIAIHYAVKRYKVDFCLVNQRKLEKVRES